MTDHPPIAAHEFVAIRQEWQEFLFGIRARLKRLDGNTSRQLGRIVQEIINAHEAGKGQGWADAGTARFLRNDSFLWHELSNSRKK